MSNASQVVAVLKRTRAKYVESAKSDIVTALNIFPDLSPDAETFTFPDGTRNLTFRLKGTIPVLYKGNTYNIPVALYLWDTHPYYAPICYVCPTSNMMVKESQTVDKQGRIYLPYLTDWRFPGYDLSGLLQVMSLCFRETCPVFAKPAGSNASRVSANTNVGGGSSSSQQSSPYTPYPTSQSVGMPPYPLSTPQPGAGQYSAGAYQPPYPNAYPSFPNPMPAQQPASIAGGGGGSLSNVTSASQASVGTIQPEHLKASLLSAIEDIVKQRLREKLGTVHAELASIRQTHSDLRSGQQKLKSIADELSREQKQIDESLLIYREKKEELQSIITSHPEDVSVDIDSLIDACTPLHKQLLRCYVHDCAIDDTIYFLGQALKQGTMTLPNYLKEVRQLSSKQFIYRATLQKCRLKAKLPT